MTIRSAVGYSEDLDEPYEAGLEISQMILKKIDLQAHSVGILFCHMDFDFATLLKGIKEQLNIPIIGCTGASEANDQGHFEEPASLMVITADDIRFGLGIGQELSKRPEEAVHTAYKAAKNSLGDHQPKLALTFPDSSIGTPPERVIDLLEKELASEAPIVGGLPADNFQFKKTYQFCDDLVCSDSIPLLLLAGNIAPLVLARSGWIPMGKQVKATKVVANVLYEIDHQPAIEYLKKYIPDVDDPALMATYPLAILDESLGAEVDRYFVIRSPFIL